MGNKRATGEIHGRNVFIVRQLAAVQIRGLMARRLHRFGLVTRFCWVGRLVLLREVALDLGVDVVNGEDCHLVFLRHLLGGFTLGKVAPFA